MRPTPPSGPARDDADVVQPLVMRGTAAELAALEGQVLASVRRRGKFLVFQFERDRVVMNFMLTGRLGLAAPARRRSPRRPSC